MSSFIVTTPTDDPHETEIVSGPFWPNIDPKAIRDAQRIDGTVPPVRLRMALIEAIASANGELRTWREGQQAAGYSKLINVPSEQIDGASILVHRYLRAVGCLAKALLLERVRDMDSTAAGDKRADDLTDPIDDCRRDYLNALADIQGRGRVTVELI